MFYLFDPNLYLNKQVILNEFKNIYSLKKKARLKIDLTYLIFLIPYFVIFFFFFLTMLDLRNPYSAEFVRDSVEFLVVLGHLLINLIFVSLAINTYRVSWTFKNSFRCFFTFCFVFIGLIFLVQTLERSFLVAFPSNSMFKYIISRYNSEEPNLLKLLLYQQNITSNNFNFIKESLKFEVALFYTQIVTAFTFHWIIVLARRLIFLYELQFSAEEIAEYLVNPENESQFEDEAFKRFLVSDKSKILKNIPNKNIGLFTKYNSKKNKVFLEKIVGNEEKNNFKPISFLRENNFLARNQRNYYSQSEEILENVRLIIARQLKIDSCEVSYESNLESDLSIDVVDITKIINDLSDFFELEISKEIFESFDKVSDIVNFIEKQVAS